MMNKTLIQEERNCIPFSNTHGPAKMLLNPKHITWLFRMNVALHKGELTACVKKKKYNSFEKAEETRQARGQKNKVVYPCPFCFHWHIGKDEDTELREYPFEIPTEFIQGMGFHPKQEQAIIAVAGIFREVLQ
jgi:hypothetical protein